MWMQTRTHALLLLGLVELDLIILLIFKINSQYRRYFMNTYSIITTTSIAFLVVSSMVKAEEPFYGELRANVSFSMILKGLVSGNQLHSKPSLIPEVTLINSALGQFQDDHRGKVFPQPQEHTF